MPVFLKLFPKTEEERTLPNPFYEATYPHTKATQRYYKKGKLLINIADEHRYKSPQQNTSKQNPTAH